MPKVAAVKTDRMPISAKLRDINMRIITFTLLWPKECTRCGGDEFLSWDFGEGYFRVCAQCSHRRDCNGRGRVYTYRRVLQDVPAPD